jgi:hypothetical protein
MRVTGCRKLCCTELVSLVVYRKFLDVNSEDSRRLRLPEFLDNSRQMKVVSFLALLTGRLYSQEIIISVRS